jgi:hypothetical protein
MPDEKTKPSSTSHLKFQTASRVAIADRGTSVSTSGELNVPSGKP